MGTPVDSILSVEGGRGGWVSAVDEADGCQWWKSGIPRGSVHGVSKKGVASSEASHDARLRQCATMYKYVNQSTLRSHQYYPITPHFIMLPPGHQ